MKRTRIVITILLLAFVAASIAYFVVAETRSARHDTMPGPGPTRHSAEQDDPAVASAPDAGKTASAAERRLVAYYFHGNVRCATCRKIEAYAHEAVTAVFTNELAAGRLQWQTVNVDEAGHEHFVEDYKLTTRSVVLVDTVNGRQTKWKNLARVWDLVGDKAAFQQYVRSETEAYLRGSD